MHYYGPMDSNDWGIGLLMMLIWLAFFAVITFVIVRALREREGSNRHSGNPIDIAKERYAKGEITKAQYEQLKKDLK